MKHIILLTLLGISSLASKSQSWVYDSIVSPTNSTATFGDFRFYADGFGWTIQSYGSFNVFQTTKDGGKTWETKRPSFFDYDAANKDSLFSFDIDIIKKRLHITLSTDQGNSWANYSHFGIPDYEVLRLGTLSYGFKVLNSNFIYGIAYCLRNSDNEYIDVPFIIKNGGQDLTNILAQVPVDEFSRVTDIEFLNSSFGLMTTKNGTYKTEDGGTTWTNIGTAKGKISILNSSTFFIADDNIQKTKDGGTKWETIAIPNKVNIVGQTQKTAVTFDFVDEDCGAFIGYKSGIFRTTDGGTSWVKDSINQAIPDMAINSYIRRIQFMGCDELYAMVAHHIVSNKKVPFGKGQTGDIANSDLINFNIYPNPSNNSVQLNIPIRSSNISIVSATGQECKVLIENNALDVSAFPNGMYMLHFNTGKKEAYAKFIVQH